MSTTHDFACAVALDMADYMRLNDLTRLEVIFMLHDEGEHPYGWAIVEHYNDTRIARQREESAWRDFWAGVVVGIAVGMVILSCLVLWL